MIEHIIVDTDNVMQSKHLPFQHPQCRVLELPENFHDMPDDSSFILCCAGWLVLTILWIHEALVGEFS